MYSACECLIYFFGYVKIFLISSADAADFAAGVETVRTGERQQERSNLWRGISLKRILLLTLRLVQSAGAGMLKHFFCTEKPLHIPIYLRFINLNYEFTDSLHLPLCPPPLTSSQYMCRSAPFRRWIFISFNYFGMAGCLRERMLLARCEIYFEIGADKHLTFEKGNWLGYENGRR